jgi:hypothetical protein
MITAALYEKIPDKKPNPKCSTQVDYVAGLKILQYGLQDRLTISN